MDQIPPQPTRPCHYFVDEAGDGTLFNKRKQVVVGQEGCSSFFILGVLEVAEPKALHDALESLRMSLLADPYLAKVPSLQPERNKTAFAFHAKDDCAEVRREVYKLLLQHEMRFFAVVRDKAVIADKVREHNKTTPSYRYQPNQLYDRCVSRLFRERLHKEESYVIQFSRRGNRARTEALQTAIEHARNSLRASWGIEATSPIEIMAAKPADAGGLQAVDYMLWALQRLYERGEERYWEFVAAKASLVHDVDDTRVNDYGVYYTKKNPLGKESLKNSPA
jgi:Protein of unknown function (DUF3800)